VVLDARARTRVESFGFGDLVNGDLLDVHWGVLLGFYGFGMGEVTKPGHLTIATKSPHANFKFPMELVERVLYEVAGNGGNCSATLRAFQAANEDRIERGEEPVELPSLRTIRHWITVSFRNRYHEICADSARQLEEIVAAQGVENAIAMGKAEADALKQTLAGLSNANGVEASQILRNISQAKGTAVQTSQLLRGRPTVITAETPLEQIARELQQLGIVEVITDAEVVAD
jgi:hypothetical protein